MQLASYPAFSASLAAKETAAPLFIRTEYMRSALTPTLGALGLLLGVLLEVLVGVLMGVLPGCYWGCYWGCYSGCYRAVIEDVTGLLLGVLLGNSATSL